MIFAAVRAVMLTLVRILYPIFAPLKGAAASECPISVHLSKAKFSRLLKGLLNAPFRFIYLKHFLDVSDH